MEFEFAEDTDVVAFVVVELVFVVVGEVNVVGKAYDTSRVPFEAATAEDDSLSVFDA